MPITQTLKPTPEQAAKSAGATAVADAAKAKAAQVAQEHQAKGDPNLNKPLASDPNKSKSKAGEEEELVTIVLVHSASYIAPDGTVFEANELVDGKNKPKEYVFPAKEAEVYLAQRAGAMPFFRRKPTAPGAVATKQEVVAMKGSPLTVQGRITVQHNPNAKGVMTGKNVLNRRLGQSGHTTIPNKDEAADTEYNRIPVATENVSERQLGVSGHTTIPNKNEVVDESVTKTASGLHTPGEGVVKVAGESGHTTRQVKVQEDGELDTAFNPLKPKPGPFKAGQIINTTADDEGGGVEV